MKYPLWSKALALAAVVMGLMWALWTVQSLVTERQHRQSEAERSVASSLASSQTLLGPVITRVCTETWVNGGAVAGDAGGALERQTHVIRLPASQVKVDAKVGLTPRYRGMFKVNGYELKSVVKAQWTSVAGLASQTMQASHPGGRVQCDEPVLNMALSDARGIRAAEWTANGKVLRVDPGSGLGAQPRGFQASLADLPLKDGAALDVVLNLELAGTQQLAWVPVADTTLIHLATDWPHPSFGGRFLPSERHVQSGGFDATWKVTSLASTAQQEWRNGGKVCERPLGDQGAAYGIDGPAEFADAKQGTACVEAFGVKFIDPVDPYTLSDRATKYGLLFIVLTFVAVGLTEVLRRLRVHPIQYLLVGAALSVFFLLLVSLSEHMLFGYAYALASLACTLLLTFYGSFVLRGWVAGSVFGIGIAGLFGTLYALLQMEQNALVLGALLIFLVLTVVMVSTRKLDWYELFEQMRGEGVAR